MAAGVTVVGRLSVASVCWVMAPILEGERRWLAVRCRFRTAGYRTVLWYFRRWIETVDAEVVTRGLDRRGIFQV